VLARQHHVENPLAGIAGMVLQVWVVQPLSVKRNRVALAPLMTAW
jgi:hypothetical protein